MTSSYLNSQAAHAGFHVSFYFVAASVVQLHPLTFFPIYFRKRIAFYRATKF